MKSLFEALDKLPVHPEVEYEGKGWKSWADWLGKAEESGSESEGHVTKRKARRVADAGRKGDGQGNDQGDRERSKSHE